MCESVPGIGFGEFVKIITPNGEEKSGEVVDVSDDITIIQLFETTSGIDIKSTGVRFTGEAIKFPVSLDILGRTFSGVGN